jgi:TonB-dependent Receptor Plug Domain
VVGQDATADMSLKVGQVTEQVKVESDVPVVSTTTQDISGLVGEKEIKALPLNGRSYDLLMTLNPGIVNFTWEKTGGLGVSNSTTGNDFCASGSRPQQNLFLLNGVEFTGAAENNMQPGGPSQNLIGVEAVREFNVLRDSYGAEYGKRPGAQVTIVTQSGTNQWHGSLYEYLRNSALDAPNYFAQGTTPPFQRNQFGGALGAPIQKDKTFFFVNFEGFIQNLHQASAAFVPDLASRAAAVPSVKPLLNLWATPTPTDPTFNGIAEVFSSPLQTVHEYFGHARFDHVFSSKDTFSAVYTIDDGADNTATIADPYSTDILTLREHLSAISSALLRVITLSTRLSPTRTTTWAIRRRVESPQRFP